MSDRPAPVRLAASLDGAAGAPVLVLGNISQAAEVTAALLDHLAA